MLDMQEVTGSSPVSPTTNAVANAPLRTAGGAFVGQAGGTVRKLQSALIITSATGPGEMGHLPQLRVGLVSAVLEALPPPLEHVA